MRCFCNLPSLRGLLALPRVAAGGGVLFFLLLLLPSFVNADRTELDCSNPSEFHANFVDFVEQAYLYKMGLESDAPGSAEQLRFADYVNVIDWNPTSPQCTNPQWVTDVQEVNLTALFYERAEPDLDPSLCYTLPIYVMYIGHRPDHLNDVYFIRAGFATPVSVASGCVDPVVYNSRWSGVGEGSTLAGVAAQFMYASCNPIPCPSPTPTLAPSPTWSPSPSLSPSPSPSPSESPTPSPVPPTPSFSPNPSPSGTPEPSPSGSPIPPSPSVGPSPSWSPSPSLSVTPSESPTSTPSPSPSPTGGGGDATPTSGGVSPTPGNAESPTPEPSVTATSSPNPSSTSTVTPTATPSITPSRTISATATPGPPGSGGWSCFIEWNKIREQEGAEETFPSDVGYYGWCDPKTGECIFPEYYGQPGRIEGGYLVYYPMGTDRDGLEVNINVLSRDRSYYCSVYTGENGNTQGIGDARDLISTDVLADGWGEHLARVEGEWGNTSIGGAIEAGMSGDIDNPIRAPLIAGRDVMGEIRSDLLSLNPETRASWQTAMMVIIRGLIALGIIIVAVHSFREGAK